MLTREENELLCRVGPEAPMGKMLRRYWLPAIMSSELVTDGTPKRVRLLGEKLVAFRDSRGVVGLIDEACPHRGASLVLGRNEDCGIRCLYHGWKLDVAGHVLETPPEPEDSSFGRRIRTTSYPVEERGGFVWAYMGPPAEMPPPMDFEWTAGPDSHRVIIKVVAACNWVQTLEGVIDSAHTNFLHADLVRPTAGLNQTTLGDDGAFSRPSNDGRPRIEVEDTPYGFKYAAIRRPLNDADAQKYVRITHFIAPIYASFPAAAGLVNMQMFVPLDDESTMHYFVKRSAEPIDERQAAIHVKRAGTRIGIEIDDEYRMKRHSDNLWLQDRAAMERGESITGITGVTTQDIVMQESMGPIYDRTKEHLGASDAALIRMRRVMLESVRRFMADGTAPIGLGEAIEYSAIHARERMIPIDLPWQRIDDAAGVGG
jgi:phthalate 4,5-dioxygenase oxygenase subunit